MLTKFNVNLFLLKAPNLAFPFSTHYRYTTIKKLTQRVGGNINTPLCLIVTSKRIVFFGKKKKKRSKRIIAYSCVSSFCNHIMNSEMQSSILSKYIIKAKSLQIYF